MTSATHLKKLVYSLLRELSSLFYVKPAVYFAPLPQMTAPGARSASECGQIKQKATQVHAVVSPELQQHTRMCDSSSAAAHMPSRQLGAAGSPNINTGH